MHKKICEFCVFFKEVMQQYICSTKQVVFQRVKHDQQVGKQFLGIQPKERKLDVHREIQPRMHTTVADTKMTGTA